MPGKLHTKLEDDYPAKPRQQQLARVGLDFDQGRPSRMRYLEDLGRVQLRSADGTRLVAVAKDTFSVHMLRPYQRPECGDQGGWREFRHRIDSGLQAYWAVSKPVGVVAVSVRYINKIVIPWNPVDLGDFLLCAAPEVTGLPDLVSGFASRQEYRYPNDGVHLMLSQGAVSGPDDQVSVLLDLDFNWRGESALTPEQAMEKATTLRELERDAFEAVITDNARELFDAT